MKNILVLIDFTDLSDNVVNHAIQWCNAFSAKCWLLHVSVPEKEMGDVEGSSHHFNDEHVRVIKQEQTEMKSLKQKIKQAGIECESLLMQGYVNNTIMDEIRKLNTDLIIMGNNHHGKLYEVVVGSVGREVLARARVPVVVVPPELS